MQSSNISLLIGQPEKKDSFFSALNTNNKLNENIYPPNSPLKTDTINHLSNNNVNLSNLRAKQNNLLLDEEYSPIRGKSHFINRFSNKVRVFINLIKWILINFWFGFIS